MCSVLDYPSRTPLYPGRILDQEVARPRLIAGTFCGCALSGEDYLSDTRIPTFHFQDSIPRLPIPVLKDTATRFLYAAKPLISEAEMAETKKVTPSHNTIPPPASNPRMHRARERM